MLFKFIICSGCVSPIVTNIVCLTTVMKCRSLEVNLVHIVGRQYCRAGDILRALPDLTQSFTSCVILGSCLTPTKGLDSSSEK